MTADLPQAAHSSSQIPKGSGDLTRWLLRGPWWGCWEFSSSTPAARRRGPSWYPHTQANYFRPSPSPWLAATILTGGQEWQTPLSLCLADLSKGFESGKASIPSQGLWTLQGFKFQIWSGLSDMTRWGWGRMWGHPSTASRVVGDLQIRPPSLPTEPPGKPKEGWVSKNWCFWTVVLEKSLARRSNQSILKKINPEYSLEGPMLKLKSPNSGHLMQRADSLEKIPMLRKTEGRRRGCRGWDG